MGARQGERGNRGVCVCVCTGGGTTIIDTVRYSARYVSFWVSLPGTVTSKLITQTQDNTQQTTLVEKDISDLCRIQ